MSQLTQTLQFQAGKKLIAEEKSWVLGGIRMAVFFPYLYIE